MQMNRLAWVLFCQAMFVLGTGCARGPAVGIVQGEVTLDGQPIKDGRISFTPVDGEASTAGSSIVDGRFQAEVPVTHMKVAINANKVVGKRKAYDTPDSPVFDDVVEMVPARYNVNSDLTLDVKRGPQEVKYDLKTK
jgi:hypothetical protein